MVIIIKVLRHELPTDYPFIYNRNGSGVELWTLDYENPGSNPLLRC